MINQKVNAQDENACFCLHYAQALEKPIFIVLNFAL